MDRNEIVCDYMNWDHLAMDGEKCRAFVSMATNNLVPQNAAIFFLTRLWHMATKEDCSMNLVIWFVDLEGKYMCNCLQPEANA
jgi:hypothetical protein